MELWCSNLEKLKIHTKQVGAELYQAQVKLEVAVEVGVEFGVEACN